VFLEETRMVEFRGADGGMLSLDLYSPGSAARLPAVVIVAGYRDEGFLARMGYRFKEMPSTVAWAQRIAAAGMVAVTYTNRDPAADFLALLRALREHADEWGIDAQRIGLWSSSGNVPVALSALMTDAGVRCAALLYGCTLDLDGATGIADAAKMFGFANPVAGRGVEDLRRDVPLFLVRAGRDEMPGLSDALDRFVGHALQANLPMTLVNYAEAPHAFDLFDNSEASREVVRQVLEFLRVQLSV
jgi:acetyl esterase/lipase